MPNADVWYCQVSVLCHYNIVILELPIFCLVTSDEDAQVASFLTLRSESIARGCITTLNVETV